MVHHYRFFAWDSLSTFFTIFCSSIRKARTMRSLTQLPHREPPYARCTDFVGRETCAYSWGRRAGICGRVSVGLRASTGADVRPGV